ncbi:MAG TPA: tetratricopeptide repeat protein [Candidatus Methylacidiphilales bacterium]|nr:tetratricopeptide repeat protein [Candidatus Methylacidiphilales bacterium]
MKKSRLLIYFLSVGIPGLVLLKLVFDFAHQRSQDQGIPGGASVSSSDLNPAMPGFSQSTATAAEPKNAKGYNDRGLARRARGDLDGAIGDYTRALALDPRYAQAYSNRGIAKQMKGDISGAIADYTQAITLDPKYAHAYNNRGIAKANLGDLNGAMADFNQAVAIDPKNPQAYHNRGMARTITGDWDGAIADYSQAIAINPKDVMACNNRGIAKANKGDLDDAIADYTMAIMIDPGDAQAFSNRGLARMAKHDLNGAIGDFQQAITLHPQNSDYAHFYLWLAQTGQNRKTDADSELTAYMTSRPDVYAGDWPSKVGGFLLGQINEADFLSAASSGDPQKNPRLHCEAWYYAGMKHLLVGEKTAAANDFQKCLATNQKDSPEYFCAVTGLKMLK